MRLLLFVAQRFLRLQPVFRARYHQPLITMRVGKRLTIAKTSANQARKPRPVLFFKPFAANMIETIAPTM